MFDLQSIILWLTSGGVLVAAISAWLWINKTIKVAKEAGSTEERLKQANEVLNDIQKAHQARIAVERDSLTPGGLQSNDGFRRD